MTETHNYSVFQGKSGLIINTNTFQWISACWLGVQLQRRRERGTNNE